MSTFLRLGFVLVLVGTVAWLIYVKRLWHVLHVLWVCRVSVLSAIGGGALVTLTEQSRDLFADLGPSVWQWTAFFVLLFIWAWVVHLVGRRSLQSDYWVPDAHCPGGLSETRRQELQREYGAVALWVPRLLGLSIFFFVGIALYDAQQNLAPARGLDEAREAHDHLVWLFLGTIATTLIFLLLVWTRRKAEARIAYGKDAHDEQPPLLIGLTPLPRSLVTWSKQGPAADSKLVWSVHLVMLLMALFVTATFVAVIVRPHGIAEMFPRAQMVPILFGSIVIILGEVVIWSYVWRTPLLLVLTIVGVLLLFWADRFHDVRFVGNPGSKGKADGNLAQISFEEAVARWKSVNCKGEECPRPILIAGAGGASRAAFATATVVGALFDRGPDIRNRVFAMSTVSGSSVGGVIIRAALADAAEIGKPNKPPCQESPGQFAWFGSLDGADRFRTAPDYGNSWRDCFQFLLAGDFLSAVVAGLVYRDNFPLQLPFVKQGLWDDRAALLEESLERRYNVVTRGEYKHCANEDNKGLCRRFGFHPHPRDVGNAWLPLLFVNGTSVATGRRIIAADVPIGKPYLNNDTLLPFAYDVNEIRNWRVKWIATDKPEQEQISFCQMAFVPKPADKMSWAEWLSWTILSAVKTEKPIDNCFRLSTASMLSARFPVISPQGNLRDRSNDIRDKIVDGGYFENDALATLADVANALKARGLHPIAVRVLNHPEPREGTKDSLGPERPALPNEDERAFFDDVLSIIRTLSATRSGHEDGHEAYLEGSLSVGEDKAKGFAGASGKDRLYEVRVYELKPESAPASSKQRQLTQKQAPQRNVLCRRNVSETKIGKTVYMETVSMSWWMSHPVQAYLDAQLCVEANWAHLECELERGRVAPGGSCAGEPLKDWLSRQ